MQPINQLTATVIEEAIRIHRELGPGLFESVYEAVLAGRLASSGLKVERQVAVPVEFDGQVFEVAYRIDLLIEDCLILEIKAVDRFSNAHLRQLHTYLRLKQQPVGLLLNFSAATMKEGIRRVVNDYRPA